MHSLIIYRWLIFWGEYIVEAPNVRRWLIHPKYSCTIWFLGLSFFSFPTSNLILYFMDIHHNVWVWCHLIIMTSDIFFIFYYSFGEHIIFYPFMHWEKHVMLRVLLLAKLASVFSTLTFISFSCCKLFHHIRSSLVKCACCIWMGRAGLHPYHFIIVVFDYCHLCMTSIPYVTTAGIHYFSFTHDCLLQCCCPI